MAAGYARPRRAALLAVGFTRVERTGGRVTYSRRSDGARVSWVDDPDAESYRVEVPGREVETIAGTAALLDRLRAEPTMRVVFTVREETIPRVERALRALGVEPVRTEPGWNFSRGEERTYYLRTVEEARTVRAAVEDGRFEDDTPYPGSAARTTERS
jgi:hypothetical protein